MNSPTCFDLPDLEIFLITVGGFMPSTDERIITDYLSLMIGLAKALACVPFVSVSLCPFWDTVVLPGQVL